MSRRAALAADALLVVLALAAAEARWPRSALEADYTGGLFARLNQLLVPLSNAVPFALFDALVCGVVALVVAGWIVGLRRRGRRPATVAALAAHTVGVAAAVVLAFEVLWGWNYQRAPLAQRLAYDPARVTDAAVAAFADRIVAILNDDAAAAHARARSESEAEMRAQLAHDFAPVIARVGDRWPVALTVPKHTVFDLLYQMAGVGGQYVPFTFETLLNASFLPFEVPRALAHEWTHVAGFGDEGDANLVGTIVCLRSPDPLVRYSGAFWTYAELPERDRARLPLSPLVRADMEAARARFLAHYQPQLFDLSWLVYDRYLRASGVAGGVASYSRFVQLLVGTPFDADGLPLTRVKEEASELGGRRSWTSATSPSATTTTRTIRAARISSSPTSSTRRSTPTSSACTRLGSASTTSTRSASSRAPTSCWPPSRRAPAASGSPPP